MPRPYDDESTYTAQEILDQARLDNLRNAAMDEIMPQFYSLLQKLISARDAGPNGDPINLTPDEAMICYRLIMRGSL